MSNREKPPFPSVIEARFEFLFDKWSQQVRVHKAHFRLMLGGLYLSRIYSRSLSIA